MKLEYPALWSWSTWLHEARCSGVFGFMRTSAPEHFSCVIQLHEAKYFMKPGNPASKDFEARYSCFKGFEAGVLLLQGFWSRMQSILWLYYFNCSHLLIKKPAKWSISNCKIRVCRRGISISHNIMQYRATYCDITSHCTIIKLGKWKN